LQFLNQDLGQVTPTRKTTYLVGEVLQGVFFSYVPEWVLKVLAQTKTKADFGFINMSGYIMKRQTFVGLFSTETECTQKKGYL